MKQSYKGRIRGENSWAALSSFPIVTLIPNRVGFPPGTGDTLLENTDRTPHCFGTTRRGGLDSDHDMQTDTTSAMLSSLKLQCSTGGQAATTFPQLGSWFNVGITSRALDSRGPGRKKELQTGASEIQQSWLWSVRALHAATQLNCGERRWFLPLGLPEMDACH